MTESVSAGVAFDAILEDFEQALEVERELGVRTFEIDRTLLTAFQAETPKAATVEETRPARGAGPTGAAVGEVRPARGTGPTVETAEAARPARGAGPTGAVVGAARSARGAGPTGAVAEAARPARGTGPTGAVVGAARPARGAGPTGAVAGEARPARSADPAEGDAHVVAAAKPGQTYDFVFLHDRPLSPGGIEIIAKSILKLGRTAENTPVVVAPPLPKARAYVVLGGLALKRWFPRLRGAPGAWCRADDGTPVHINYSPEYILRFEQKADDLNAVKVMKGVLWKGFKSVAQHIA